MPLAPTNEITSTAAFALTHDDSLPEPMSADNDVTVPGNGGRFSLFAMAGQSDNHARAALMGLAWISNTHWLNAGNWYQSPGFELVAGYWFGHEGTTQVDSLHEAGLTANVRTLHHRRAGQWLLPFVDFGMGIHYLTEDRIENKRLGNQWQIGSNLGMGLLFGRDGNYEVGMRASHLSNAGTSHTNWGINYYLLRLAYHF